MFIILFLSQSSFTGTNFYSHNPSHSNLDYNLEQNKMEEQASRPPTPPPQKIVEDEAAQKPKRAIFPALIGGMGGGINFQSLRSKIFYR